MSNAASRLLNAVDPKKTRGRLEGVADARTPAERQIEAIADVPPEAPSLAKARTTAGRGKWKLTVPVSEEARRELKKICLDRDISVEAFVRDALNAHLRSLGLDDLVIR